MRWVLGAAVAAVCSCAALAQEAPTAPFEITKPTWVRRPRASDIAAVYPSKAEREGRSGQGEIRCAVTAEGRLKDCAVISESPEGYEFGRATQRLAYRFMMPTKTPEGRSVEGATVTISIQFAVFP